MRVLNKIAENQPHFGPVKCLMSSPDSTFIFSLGRDDGVINVLSPDDLSSTVDLATLSSDMILAVAVVPQRSMFYFLTNINEIYSVEWPSQEKKQVHSQTESDLYLIATDEKGELLAFTGSDSQITIISPREYDAEPINIYDSTDEVVWMSFNQENKYLAVYNKDKKLMVFTPPEYDQLTELNIGTVPSNGFAWGTQTQIIFPDTQQVGSINILDITSGNKATLKLNAHDKPINLVSLSQNFLTTIDANKNIAISDFSVFLSNGFLPILYSTKFEHEDNFETLGFYNNNLLIGGDNGNIFLFEAIQQVDVEKEAPTQVLSAAIGTDESELEDLSQSQGTEPVKKIQPGKRDVLQSVKDKSLKKKQKPDKPKVRLRPVITASDVDEEEEKLEEEEDIDEEEEEEEDQDENGEQRGKFKFTRFLQDAADETGSEDDEEIGGEITPKKQETRSEKKRQEMYQELLSRVGGDDDHVSDSTSSDVDFDENAKPSEEQLKERRRQHREDKKFLADSDQSTDEAEEEDMAEFNLSEMSERESDIEDIDETNLSMMPGCTRKYVNKKRFLCYNLIGSVFLRIAQEDVTFIDVEYADTIANRNTHFENNKAYIMASLNENGLIIASRQDILFILNHPWSNDFKFAQRYPEEESIDLVACGGDWFACATEKQLLRIYLSSGFEYASLPIPQRAYTMVGGVNNLFVVYGENFQYMLLDIPKRKVKATGVLPIRTPLRWTGFDEDTCYVVSNDYVLYALVFEFGHQWFPMCNISDVFNEDISDYWTVGVKNGSIWGITLKKGENLNTVSHQELTEIPICPLTNNAKETKARNWLYMKMKYANANKQNRTKEGTQLDIETLKLYADACKNNQPEIMLQLGLEIVTQKVRNYAVDYAEKHEAEEVARQLSEYYKQFEEEEEENQQPEEEEESETEKTKSQDTKDEGADDENIQHEESDLENQEQENKQKSEDEETVPTQKSDEGESISTPKSSEGESISTPKSDEEENVPTQKSDENAESSDHENIEEEDKQTSSLDSEEDLDDEDSIV